MNKNKERVRRPYYVYNLPQNLLNTLTPKGSATYNYRRLSQRLETSNGDVAAQSDNSIVAQTCSLCVVSFINVEEQRDHVRSDLHCYNVRQKTRGRKIVTEREFEELICDLSESISGSDLSEIDEDDEINEPKVRGLSAQLKREAIITTESAKSDDEDSEKQTQVSRKNPLIYFMSSTLPANTYLGIYRSIFTDAEQNDESTILESLKKKQITTKSEMKNMHRSEDESLSPQANIRPHFFLCMIGGGHFAAMLVSLIPKQNNFTTGTLNKDITILAHKTFHRYTTRRKQGGAQSANDSAKGAANSAGASLRRYNEQALMDEVRLLLHGWKNMIDSSELLFIRATGSTSRQTLFGPYNNQVLQQKDPRIRSFPFTTRRPTQKELINSFIELTQAKFIEIKESEVTAEPFAKLQTVAQNLDVKADNRSSLASSNLTEEEETALLHTSQIQALIRRNRLPALLSYLKTNCLSSDFHFHPLDSLQNYHAPTPLIFAAHVNSAPIITGLLLKGNANPEVRNQNGKTAYDLAGDRASRQAFRVARFELGEDKWNWEQTGIPSGISRSQADAEIKKEKEEEDIKERQRRKLELENLKIEDPGLLNKNLPLGKIVMNGRVTTIGKVQKTAQEKREDEARGLTPETRMKLDRERRARAAEDRIRKMASGTL